MNPHWNTNTCRTCSAWDQHYPDNKQLGDCKRLPVLLHEGVTFPPELCNDPKPPAPSKSKIKAAILAGQPVNGARIVKRDRLTIK